MYETVVSALCTCVDAEKGCVDCVYYQKCMNSTSGKHAAMVDAADAIEELNKPSWIPTSERLPEPDDGVAPAVLTVDNLGVLRVAYFTGRWYMSGCDNELSTLRVAPITHWMPLPNPPKEG